MSQIMLVAVALVAMSALAMSQEPEAEKRFYSWEAGATPSKRGKFSWAGKRSAPVEDE